MFRNKFHYFVACFTEPLSFLKKFPQERKKKKRKQGKGRGEKENMRVTLSSTYFVWFSLHWLVNALSPIINGQILYTDLHKFPYKLVRRILSKEPNMFPVMSISWILTTFSFDCVMILLGETLCWSLLGLKGLTINTAKPGG